MSTADVLAAVVADWVNDPESAVEYAEEVDGRWAIRVRQVARPFTTVWWELGERSLRFEAYVLPLPPDGAEGLLRQCLIRNHTGWRVRFAIDRRQQAVVLGGRIPVERVDPPELDFILGELYETLEVSYPALVRAWTDREKSS